MKSILACISCLAFLLSACGPTSHSPISGASFREVADEAGLRFLHESGASGNFQIPEITGSGVAVFDYDNDGDLDVFLVQSGALNSGASSRQPQGSRLFRNEFIPSGKLRFADVTQAAGLTITSYGMGVAVGDFDGDQHPDLLVTALDGIALWRNNADGTFTDRSAAAGLSASKWCTGAVFFDYDGDGDQDLFVARYVDYSPAINRICQGQGGEKDYCAPNTYPPLSSLLFRNEGNGRFLDVSLPSGISGARGNGFTVAILDADGDGKPDVFVANDGTPNHLWMNRGEGRFEELGVLSGVGYNGDGKALAGMGAAVEDFDADGDDDIFVTNLTAQPNTLYRNLGRGLFEDSSAGFRLNSTAMPYTGWARVGSTLTMTDSWTSLSPTAPSSPFLLYADKLIPITKGISSTSTRAAALFSM